MRSSGRWTSRSSATGGLLALFGNIAPNGAILKCAAADERLFEHVGRAVVFKDLDDLAARIDDPALDVQPDDVLVLQNAGPIGAGMPEAGYLPIPAKLARAGVKDMVRISDARMSGTAFGTVDPPRVARVRDWRAARAGAIRRPDSSQREGATPRGAAVRERTARPAVRGDARPVPPRGLRPVCTRRSVLGAEHGCDFDFLRQRPVGTYVVSGFSRTPDGPPEGDTATSATPPRLTVLRFSFNFQPVPAPLYGASLDSVPF